MSLEGTTTNLRRVLRSLLRDRKHSPIHDWLVVSTVDGHIAARAPTGECFTIAIVPMPAGGADAQALAEVAAIFGDPERRPRRAQR